MPFNGTETPAIRRARLIEALRYDTEWEWNFCNSAGCAIGMARAIWRDIADLTKTLGLSGNQHSQIFGFIDGGSNRDRGLHKEWCDFYGMPRTEVTPSMVADALEKIT